MKHPVVILGGGLAGLALAIDLKRNGVSTLVIEKGSYPRHKVCGEYISMESHDYLVGLCPELKKYSLPQISNFRLSSVGGIEINLHLELGGFGVSRFLLEDLLYRQALSSGVEVLTDTRALAVNFCESEKRFQIVLNDDTIVHASMVCNATGKKSNFETKIKAGYLNKTNYVGVKYHVHLKREPCSIEIHNFNGGYCGISNIENNKSCLCYMANSALLNKHHNSIPEMEQMELFKNRNLASIFNTAEFLTETPLTISGINFRIKKPVSDGVFYLGDAAGCLAPITGNGMSMALRSASTLTRNIVANKATEFPFREIASDYTHFWNQEFSTRIKFSRHLQKLAEFPSLTKISILLMKTFPGLARKLVRSTHGTPF